MSVSRTHATIDWLQALRGLAAVAVVITHAGWTLAQPAHKELAWEYFAHGALGVDLFFVISGFIMFLTTRGCDGSPRYVADFAIKRFARIWPLFCVVSLIYLGLAWQKAGAFPSTYFADVASQLVFRPVSAKASEFFRLPVDVAWTLCFEAYFYVVIAVSLFSRKWRWWIVAALLAPGLVLYPLLTQEWNFSFYHQSAIAQSHYLNLAINPMVWEFVLGLVAGWLYTRDWTQPKRPVAYCMIAAAGMAFIAIPETHTATLYGPTIEYGGLTVFAIFMLVALASKAVRLPVARWLVWLGTISYSIYLTHKLGFMAAAQVSAWLNIQNASTRDWVGFAIHLACGIGAGALFHYAVEAPLSARVRDALMQLGRRGREADFANTQAA
ncbi:acyltransferase family protein [Diaphorobacter caeni]|uniref:acyltransferase family protein n=1 Tax=Diaphorobacter caeni TaxID=2784387 RepID=UPI00188EFA60|nr:acyltransferase [Diaphorobacter caeni]MBF5004645.1 acyltransferase [Diaphorobacter caeni]